MPGGISPEFTKAVVKLGIGDEPLRRVEKVFQDLAFAELTLRKDLIPVVKKTFYPSGLP